MPKPEIHFENIIWLKKLLHATESYSLNDDKNITFWLQVVAYYLEKMTEPKADDQTRNPP